MFFFLAVLIQYLSEPPTHHWNLINDGWVKKWSSLDCQELFYSTMWYSKSLWDVMDGDYFLPGMSGDLSCKDSTLSFSNKIAIKQDVNEWVSWILAKLYLQKQMLEGWGTCSVGSLCLSSMYEVLEWISTTASTRHSGTCLYYQDERGEGKRVRSSKSSSATWWVQD